MDAEQRALIQDAYNHALMARGGSRAVHSTFDGYGLNWTKDYHFLRAYKSASKAGVVFDSRVTRKNMVTMIALYAAFRGVDAYTGESKVGSAKDILKTVVGL